MVIVSESVRGLKGFLRKTGLNEFAMAMILRMVVAFISHRGRMSCSAAGGEHRLGSHSSWATDSLSGAHEMAEMEFQRSPAFGAAATGSSPGAVHFYHRRDAGESGGREDSKY